VVSRLFDPGVAENLAEPEVDDVHGACPFRSSAR
jgi:hypothetical protein